MLTYYDRSTTFLHPIWTLTADLLYCQVRNWQVIRQTMTLKLILLACRTFCVCSITVICNFVIPFQNHDLLYIFWCVQIWYKMDMNMDYLLNKSENMQEKGLLDIHTFMTIFSNRETTENYLISVWFPRLWNRSSLFFVNKFIFRKWFSYLKYVNISGTKTKSPWVDWYSHISLIRFTFVFNF